ncbi:nst1, partial [Ophiophagus hannah]
MCVYGDGVGKRSEGKGREGRRKGERAEGGRKERRKEKIEKEGREGGRGKEGRKEKGEGRKEGRKEKIEKEGREGKEGRKEGRKEKIEREGRGGWGRKEGRKEGRKRERRERGRGKERREGGREKRKKRRGEKKRREGKSRHIKLRRKHRRKRRKRRGILIFPKQAIIFRLSQLEAALLDTQANPQITSLFLQRALDQTRERCPSKPSRNSFGTSRRPSPSSLGHGNQAPSPSAKPSSKVAQSPVLLLGGRDGVQPSSAKQKPSAMQPRDAPETSHLLQSLPDPLPAPSRGRAVPPSFCTPSRNSLLGGSAKPAQRDVASPAEVRPLWLAAACLLSSPPAWFPEAHMAEVCRLWVGRVPWPGSSWPSAGGVGEASKGRRKEVAAEGWDGVGGMGCLSGITERCFFPQEATGLSGFFSSEWIVGKEQRK